MPVIKVDHVVSFSSEDPTHVANNLLSNDPAKKWKCKNAGERQATIVLQLEKASVISAIDIGNENSAYVEVLVGRSSNTSINDDYKVLLVMSSFMTPLDARQSINTNKVRMFTHDQLSKPECEEKWDRIKIVCSQVFNRRVQYGLSFVTFHSPDDKNKASGPLTQTTLGSFTLRAPSPDNLSAGSLFAKRKELVESEPLKGAAAIRQASTPESLLQSGSPVCKPKLKDYLPKTPRNDELTESLPKPKGRNRNELLYDDNDDRPNKKIDKLIEEKLKETESKNKELDLIKEKKLRDSSKRKNLDEPSSSKRKRSSSAKNTPKKVKSDNNQRKPFNQLLSGVTLVISGIQNPDRGDLRSKALALGAKYKPDWDNNSCTHLICAFPNTPKFREVKGKGKIVKKEWILECHSQRKRLPWRRFALDITDGTKVESEDEILEETNDTPVNIVSSDHSDDNDGSDKDGYDDTKMQAKIDEILAKKAKPTLFGETDDEIEEISPVKEISDSLPDFFNNKLFFIDETLEEGVYKVIARYIIAYKGKIAENPTNDVDIIISTEQTVDTIKDMNSQSTYLRPDWIWECHNKKKLIPYDAYIL